MISLASNSVISVRMSSHAGPLGFNLISDVIAAASLPPPPVSAPFEQIQENMRRQGLLEVGVFCSEKILKHHHDIAPFVFVVNLWLDTADD